MTINISKDFTITPGPRSIIQGDYSGELFRDTLLIPAFKECASKKEQLSVVLDGTYGYFDSFLEEAFGGLARIYGTEKVLATVIIISEEDPSLIEKVSRFIKDSNNEKK